jgi:hypothetical protein
VHRNTRYLPKAQLQAQRATGAGKAGRPQRSLRRWLKSNTAVKRGKKGEKRRGGGGVARRKRASHLAKAQHGVERGQRAQRAQRAMGPARQGDSSVLCDGRLKVIQREIGEGAR